MPLPPKFNSVMRISPSTKSMLFGQVSWRIASAKVTAAITEQGGHLAPVKFRLRRRIVEPFSIAPFGGIVLSSPEGIRIKTKVDTQFLQNI